MEAYARGRTLTKAFKIETRQHELLGYDLGEGPARRHLKLGIILAAAWIILMIPVLGVPNEYTTSVYLIPPGVLIALGVQPDPRQPRRMRLTAWVLSAFYGLNEHQPIVNLGARKAYRGEYVSFAERSGWLRLMRIDMVRRLFRRAPEHGRRTTAAYSGPVGKPVDYTPMVRLVGVDHLHSAIAKAEKKNGKNR